MPRLTTTFLLLLLGSCAQELLERDAGMDAGPPDAGLRDGGVLGGSDSGIDGGMDAGFDAGAPREWVGIIGTGQSLSVGAGANPAVSTTQAYGGLKLIETGATTNYPLDGKGTWSTRPMTEPIRAKSNCTFCLEYPDNVNGGETPHTAMSTQLSVLSLARGPREFITAHSVVGTGAMDISNIDKFGPDGGARRPPYPASLIETRHFKNLAADAGFGFRTGAIVMTHGESDWANGHYLLDLVRLHADYNADLKSITGQTTDIPMFLTQQNNFPASVDAGLSVSAELQWKSAVLYPGKFVVVGPKYQYAHGDFVHLNAPGYRRLGEKYAQVIDAVLNLKQTWKPLYPIATSLSGSKVTVTFHVPFPPLAWNERMPQMHQVEHLAWKDGRAFEVLDSTGELTIVSATIVGNTVELLLSAPPTGTGLTVRHAAQPDGANFGPSGYIYFGGQGVGRVGNLHDSDPFLGAFQVDIPVKGTAGQNKRLTVLDAGPALFVGKNDLVLAPNLPTDTLIVTRASDAGSIDLSDVWDGGLSATTVKVRYDHRNYAVQFILPVPYTE